MGRSQGRRSFDAQLDQGTREPFAVDVSANGSEALLVLHGELEFWSRHLLADALALIDEGYVRVVLDLTDLDLIDAGGVGLIDRARTIGRMRGIEFALRSPKRAVYRVLQMTGLDDAVAGHEEVAFGLAARRDTHAAESRPSASWTRGS